MSNGRVMENINNKCAMKTKMICVEKINLSPSRAGKKEDIDAHTNAIINIFNNGTFRRESLKSVGIFSGTL